MRMIRLDEVEVHIVAAALRLSAHRDRELIPVFQSDKVKQSTEADAIRKEELATRLERGPTRRSTRNNRNGAAVSSLVLAPQPTPADRCDGSGKTITAGSDGALNCPHCPASWGVAHPGSTWRLLEHRHGERSYQGKPGFSYLAIEPAWAPASQNSA